MKQIFIVLLSLLSATLFAQTKAIAFKSHSGDMNNFRVALSNELFGSEGSNFGILFPYLESDRLASVTYISKSKVVLKILVYRKERRDTSAPLRFEAVRMDTVYDDPLFSRRHSLDSIKEVLKTSRMYDNPVDEIVFIGYDNFYYKVNQVKENKKSTIKSNYKPKENSSPVVTPGNDSTPNSPFDAALAKALAGILLLALVGGWLSWKYGNYLTKKHNRIPDQLAVA